MHQNAPLLRASLSVVMCSRAFVGLGQFVEQKSRATNEGRNAAGKGGWVGLGLHDEVVFRFSGATGGVGH